MAPSPPLQLTSQLYDHFSYCQPWPAKRVITTFAEDAGFPFTVRSSWWNASLGPSREIIEFPIGSSGFTKCIHFSIPPFLHPLILSYRLSITKFNIMHSITKLGKQVHIFALQSYLEYVTSNENIGDFFLYAFKYFLRSFFIIILKNKSDDK